MDQTQQTKVVKKMDFLKNEKVRDFLPSVIIIAILVFGGELLNPGFAKANNLCNILAKSSILAVACIGQAFVMISGNAGIDMSIGAMMSLSALIGPMVSGGTNEGLILAVVVFMATGLVIGIINGLCIQFLKIPSLVMTLAMSVVINGLTLGLTRGQPIMTIPKALLDLGMPLVGKIRGMTFVAAAILVIMIIILNKTNFGHSLFMVGSNRNAAKLAGLKVDLIVVISYGISLMMAGLAGLMLVGYVGSAQLNMADEYTLLSVAAVVIGGTKLSGGKGGLLGGALGAVVLFLLTSILVALGLPSGVRQLIQGVVLLLIVLANSREAKLRV